ncbi:MAG: hypothetical protein ACXWVR_02570, partial [Rhodoplanes sp.]
RAALRTVLRNRARSGWIDPWTGGTGGSYVGTTPGAPTLSSKTDQPATASGIDSTKSTTGSGRDGC